MRVLVIEDDRKVASFIQSGLEQEGYAEYLPLFSSGKADK